MGFREWLFGDTDLAEAPLAERAEQNPATKPPARTAASSTVNAGEALSLSMVYRAVSIHTVATKQLTLDAYRGDDKQERPLLLRRPSADMSRSAFLETAVVSLATNGNAYWRKLFKADGTVSSLVPLNPLDVTPETTRAGRITGYRVTDRDEPYTPDQIQHLALLRVPGTAQGLGPIQAARAEIRGALDQRDYATGWFDRGGQPTGILKSEQYLDNDTAKRYKDEWNNTVGAKQGVAVIGAGLDYKPVYLSPKDVQFIEGQQFTTTQIARLFGVPASLMLAAVEGSSQTYANVEQDWLGYVRFSLMQYLVEIEEALTECLPGRVTAKFNVDALLRADTTTRYQAHKVALEGGWMTVDEIRDIENLAPNTDLPKGGAPNAGN